MPVTTTIWYRGEESPFRVQDPVRDENDHRKVYPPPLFRVFSLRKISEVIFHERISNLVDDVVFE